MEGPPGKLYSKQAKAKSVPSFQPAGTMGSTTEVTVSTPKTYQTAKKNTAFAQTACHKGWQTSQAKASRLYNLLVPWEVPRKLPLAPQRLTKQRRKTPHLLKQRVTKDGKQAKQKRPVFTTCWYHGKYHGSYR